MAPTMAELQKIAVAAQPTPGQGIALGLDGKLPVSVSQPWVTGDYKISAQPADHADAGGGKWLLCDATAIDATYTALIALVGATRPDARGRTLVMQGTNASVSTLLANDGQAVANRRPHHRTSNNLTVSGNGAAAPVAAMSGGASNVVTAQAAITLGGSIGTNNANDALDTPSFLVPGNLFVHT